MPADDSAQPGASGQAQATTAVQAGSPRTADVRGEPAQPPQADSQPQAVDATAEQVLLATTDAPSVPVQPVAASPGKAMDAVTDTALVVIEAPSAHAQLDGASPHAVGSVVEDAAPSERGFAGVALFDAASPPDAATAAAAQDSSASPQAPRVPERLAAAGQPGADAETAEEDLPPSAEELPRTLTGSKRAAKRQRRRQREAAARRAAAPPAPAPTSLDLAAVLPATAASLSQNPRAAKRARTQ